MTRKGAIMSMFMNRKSISGLLVLIMGFLLLTGCSSKKVQETADEGTGTTQENVKEESAVEQVLPADAKVGIVYTNTGGSFTNDFLSRMEGYLTSAGVAPESIDRREARSGKMEEAARELIDGGCSVLVAGNADPSVAGAITKAASKAGVPVARIPEKTRERAGRNLRSALPMWAEIIRKSRGKEQSVLRAWTSKRSTSTKTVRSV